jgi:hypothetical protein
MKELELENSQAAREDLSYIEKRQRFINQSVNVEEMDLKIQKIKRFI